MRVGRLLELLAEIPHAEDLEVVVALELAHRGTRQERETRGDILTLSRETCEVVITAQESRSAP